MKKFIYENNPWTYNGEIVTSELVTQYVGFVYLIHDTENGMKYIGKKFSWSHRKVAGKTRKQRTESNWKKYFGSNEVIKDLVKVNPERFRREILHFCKCERRGELERSRRTILKESIVLS
jgi:hypothetical protein